MGEYKYRFWFSKAYSIGVGIIAPSILLLIIIFNIILLVLLLPTNPMTLYEAVIISSISAIALIAVIISQYFHCKKFFVRVYLYEDKIAEKFFKRVSKTIYLSDLIKIGIGRIESMGYFIYILDGEFLVKKYNRNGFLYLCGRNMFSRVKHTGSLIMFRLTKESLAAIQDIYDGDIEDYQKYIDLVQSKITKER